MTGKQADLTAIKKNLASLNEIIAELTVKVSDDPEFTEMTRGVLRDHSWSLGYQFQGEAAPDPDPTALVQAPGNCAGCGHLLTLHGEHGCGGKVYPSYSLDGEPCPCDQIGAYVAEYQRLPDGILFRVVALPQPLGIIYVKQHTGVPEDDPSALTAETFEGRRLPEVPPAARAVVTAYIKEGKTR